MIMKKILFVLSVLFFKISFAQEPTNGSFSITHDLSLKRFIENKGQFDASCESNSYYARFILALPITPKIKLGLQSENYFDFFENTDPQKREVESMFMNPSDSKQIIIINGIQAYLKVQF